MSDLNELKNKVQKAYTEWENNTYLKSIKENTKRKMILFHRKSFAAASILKLKHYTLRSI